MVKEPPILGISKASKDPWFSWKNQVKDRQFLWAVIWFVNFVEIGEESTYQYQFSNSFENRAYISLSLSEELVFGFLWTVAVNPKNRLDNRHGSVGVFLVPTTALKPRITFLDEWIRQMYLPSSMDAALRVTTRADRSFSAQGPCLGFEAPAFFLLRFSSSVFVAWSSFPKVLVKVGYGATMMLKSAGRRFVQRAVAADPFPKWQASSVSAGVQRLTSVAPKGN